jgi:hypothetical protein
MKKLIKHTEGYYSILLSKGFSIIPIQEYKDNHKPNLFSTTPFYTDAANLLQFDGWYRDKKTVSFGLLTGQSDVEAIDIDSKILKTKQDRDSFLKEYFGLLESHIDDFYSKFCIVKTQSGGFHILYKSKLVTGNKKIAKPKGYKEALIESRGLKGFVYIYKVVKGLQYHEIDYVSDEDRKMLWQISETYNYEETVAPKVRKHKTIQQDGVTPWEDYANKNSILDICSDDFDVVAHKKKSTLIKRKGADSYFSGHIFDDSNKMFLFSSGTIYPHEKPLNSFDVYTYKHHRGDYSEATKQAYADGYGDRYEIKIEPVIVENKITIDGFPLDILPEFFSNYILECNNKLNASVDFMGCSLLWLMSTLIGNTFKVKVKNGWVDSPILWISIIGNAGVGKTPDIKLILKPLLDLNSQEIKRYAKKMREFEEYEKLSKEDKGVNATLEMPTKSQMIVDDITMESLIDMHNFNPKSIGVFKDELAGWFKDMNRYRDGSDKERFLSAWSGDSIVLNRKTAADAFVENPFIPIMGGIQPGIFKEFQTTENHSNGFMDRMLFCDPHKIASLPTFDEMEEKTLNDYRDTIFNIKEEVDKNYTKISEGVIVPNVIALSKDAKLEYHKAHCDLVNLQNSDNEVYYYKGMYAKQITYIPRFALLIEALECFHKRLEPIQVSKESMLKAIKLSNYFISMAKVNKTDTIASSKIKQVYDQMKGKTNKEIAIELLRVFPKESKTKLSEVMEISRQTFHKHTKK